jgi:hypothetical protein
MCDKKIKDLDEKEEHTLSKEQIENWRKVIFIQLEQKMPGAGAYAIIMPESEIIEYCKKMKAFLESPKVLEQLKEPERTKQKPIKPPCNHSNSITGSKGKYCLDCEKYV